MRRLSRILSLVAVVSLVGCGGGGSGNTVGAAASPVNPAPVTYPVTLSWDAPTTNADGTQLTDLAGFRIYDGPSSRGYTMVSDVGNVTTFTMDLPAGTYYLAVTAYDTSGNESDYSMEVNTAVPVPSGDYLAANP